METLSGTNEGDEVTDSIQEHVPAGAPDNTGGQWAPKTSNPPETDLIDDTAGSFLFPPLSYNGFEGYIKFWETAPISDRVLSNLVVAYEQNRERWIGEQLDAWAKKRSNDPELLKWARSPKTTAVEIQIDHERARAEELARLRAERPIDEIGPVRARGVAIAAQLYRFKKALPPEDQVRVNDHKIRITFVEEPKTVRQIWQQYHLTEIVDHALVDADFAVTAELAELRKHLGARDII